MAKKTNKSSKKDIYLNNPNLPTAEAQFEYTPEMVAEIQKCKDNVTHFSENYFYIINPDLGKIKIPLYDYQKAALEMITNGRYSILNMSRQAGKCFCENTLHKVRDKNSGEESIMTVKELFEGSEISNATQYYKDEKIIESHKLEDLEILTDTGYHPITHVHKTIKYDVYILKTPSFMLQCADDHIVYNDKFREVFVKNIVLGQEIQTQKGGERVIEVYKAKKPPEYMYDVTVDSNDHRMYTSGILSHNTTITTAVCLWLACFNENQNILIVANKETTAKNIFKRIRMAYEELPNWLKPGVREYGKESLELVNGSAIGISTTTGTAARGTTATCVFIDEIDWIDPGMLSEFWASVYPIISASKKAKIIVASTPRDTSGLFFRLYSESVKGTNAWKNIKVTWDQVPGRDEKWKQETISSMSDPSSFFREFECVFDEVGESGLDNILFDKFRNECCSPIETYEDGAYVLWERPHPDHIYVAGVDVSEGVGKDSSVIQILDITNLRNIIQAAIYSSNTIAPQEFTPKLHEILQHWGMPIVLIERNNCGAQVVDNLKKDFNYTNIVSHGASLAGKKKGQLGMVSHTNTKWVAVSNQRYWINIAQSVRFNDVGTIHELKNFIRLPGQGWAARPGEHDDRVMALSWALMILEDEIVERYLQVLERDINRKPLVIKKLDYGISYFLNPRSMYKDTKGGNNLVLPVIFNDGSGGDTELSDLYSQGYTPFGM